MGNFQQLSCDIPLSPLEVHEHMGPEGSGRRQHADASGFSLASPGE